MSYIKLAKLAEQTLNELLEQKPEKKYTDQNPPEEEQDPNEGPSQQQIDPITGQPISQQEVDPVTGLPFGQIPGDTGQVDPMTGLPSLTAEEIGKIYELKKIYQRLITMESYLGSNSDIVLLKVRNYVSQVIDLFNTLISNITTFKADLDKIIILYYMFLRSVYSLVEKYFTKKEDLLDKEKKNQ